MWLRSSIIGLTATFCFNFVPTATLCFLTRHLAQNSNDEGQGLAGFGAATVCFRHCRIIVQGTTDIVRGLYDAFARGDVAAVLQTLDAGITWREADGFLYAGGNPYIGRQAVLEGVFQRLGSDVQNFLVLPENFIEGGDSVVVEGRYKGTVKATGTPVDAQFAHVWQLRNGKVVRFQQYTDTRQWARAAAC